MITRKAYKFALRASPGQERLLARFTGSCRYVWNRALAIQKKRLDAGEGVLRYGKLCALLPAWKREVDTVWLKESPSHTLQQTLKNLDRALMDAFDVSQPLKQFPRFKKKGVSRESFRYPDPAQFEVDNINARIRLPKLGWIRFRKSREIEGTPKQVTVSKQGERWYVSIQVELDIPDPVHPHPDNEVGIDLGVTRFATLSDGTHLEGLHSFRRLEKRLAKEQRNLSRKITFSSNWKKQKVRVAKIHRRIANARADYLHKASTAITKNHGAVMLEDLQVSAMSASAKGTVEAPGRNVKAKSGLNKAILDQGWYEFRRQFEYKSAWLGGRVVLVDPKNTSRRCSKCGHTAAENRTSQASFECVTCGHKVNADLNAAVNILTAGHAVSACGEDALVSSVKQEPAGRIAA